MYAIFQAKGKQFRAEPDGTIRMPSIDAEPGDQLTFDEVLLAERDGGEVLVGRPAIDGASVSAEVVRHGKGDKIIVYKMKRRKGYRRKQGHRQKFTEVRIVEIDLEEAAVPPVEADEEAPPPEPEPEAEVEAPEPEEAEEPEPEAAEEAEPVIPEDFSITNAARELAEEHGIDVTKIEGTGKDGRVLKGDVQAVVKEQKSE